MFFQCTTVTDAWFQLIRAAYLFGYRQDVQRGSFADADVRLQLPFASATIEKPLDDFIPTVPDGVAPPVTREYVEQYFTDYILHGRDPDKNEQYTYATRIDDQVDKVCDILRRTPQTNQAHIVVGRPDDLDIEHPACLREIGFKVVSGALEMTTFWRSHDLWAGFPANLGALGMLQEFVAEFCGVDMGVMHYASNGAHVYGYQVDSVKAKLVIS